MKKLLIIVVALCVSMLSYAQKAEYYKFESVTGSGTYTELSSATSLTGASKYKEAELDKFKGYVFTKTDEAISVDSAKKIAADITGFPIGFDFTYCGETYNRFIPISDGYIMLAKDKIDKTKLTSGTSLPTAASIGLVGDNGVKYYPTLGTGISYKTEGEVGSKILSVEFKKLSYSALNEGKLADSITYTIKLYESENRIELYFGSMYVKSGGTWFRVGMAGITNRDEHYRRPISDSWDNTEYTNNAAGLQNFANKTITKGTTYKFSIPDACVKPTTFATIDAQIKSDIIEFEAKMPEATDGDGYICIFSDKELTANPVNGTIYTAGDEIGGGTVVLFHESRPSSLYNNQAKKTELIPNTKYYVNTYMLNIKCLDGPVYGDKADTILTTKTTAPAALDLVYENDVISLSPKLNALNEEIVVLASTVKGTDLTGVNEILVGDFGVLKGDYQIGDTVLTDKKTFGGEVIYVGAKPEEAIKYSDLKDNVIYHFGAFSKSSNGEYSFLFAQADTITKASVPFFEDFRSMPTYKIPYGWEGETFQVQNAANKSGVDAMLDNKEGDPSNAWISTPYMMFPAERDARLVLDYNMSQYQGRLQVGLKPEHWNEKDSIIISIGEKGQAYKVVYAITKNNADAFANTGTYIQRYINMPGYRGKNVSVKMEYSMKKPITGKTYLRLNTFSIVEKPDCDYPMEVMVIDSSVYSDKATIFSKTIGDEQQWKYKYKTPSSDWSKEVLVSSNPFEITDLPHRDSIKVAVKAVCALGKESPYTESAYFYSGYHVPFLEDFNKFPTDGALYRPSIILPYGMFAAMETLKGEEITLDLLSGSQAIRIVAPFDMDNNVVYNPQTTTNGGISMPMSSMTKTPWLLLPAVELEENVTTNISFDISLRDAKNEYKTPTDVSKGMAFKIMVSTDGKTFKKTNTVLDLDKTALLNLGDKKNYSAPLTGYKGKVYIGLYYIQDTASAYESPYIDNILYVDNIQIAVPCGDVKGLKATEVTETFANIKWDAFPGVSSYKAEVVEVGLKDTTKLDINTNTFNLETLTKGTQYRVEVYYMCGEAKSKSAILLFTTAGIDCNVPTALTVADISKTSARLSWSGEAASYMVGIKSVNEEDFITQETDKKTLDMQSLTPGTSYVFRVKALCSAADTSVWSETKEFTTNAITCFPPTDIVVEPLFVSAKVSYKGTADKYQIAYRQGEEGNTNPWIIKNAEGKAFEIMELQPKKNYQLRIRSVCSAGDTSDYSAIKAFTTVEIPACPLVTDLKVSDTTKNSAKLSWTGSEENTGYIVRYRAVNATKWDSIKDITKTEYDLGSLTKNTAYTWTVNASCTYDRWSGWATPVNFTTLDEVSVEENLNAYFRIYASNGSITLINTIGIMVNEISVYTTNGQKVDSYKTKTNYNAVIPTKLKATPAMVVVSTEMGTVVYKIMLP